MVRERRFQLEALCQLPEQFSELEVLASSIGVNGDAIWLLRDPAEATNTLTVLINELSAGVFRGLKISGISFRFSLIDLLPNQGFVLADSRVGRTPEGFLQKNAMTFDKNGAQVAEFCLGDGIEHLLTDAKGEIWTGYFDEGVYASEPSFGSTGLVRWSPQGERLWCYEPPQGIDLIDDCYALNVGAEKTWMSYYSSFPLVGIRNGAVEGAYQTPVSGCRAITVHRNRVLFIGDHQGAWQATLCDLSNDGAAPVVIGELRLPEGLKMESGQFVARGSRLYLRVNRNWFVHDLSDEIDPATVS